LDKKAYIKSSIYEDLNKLSERVDRKHSIDILVSEVLQKYGLNPRKNEVISKKTCINYLLVQEKEKHEKKRNLGTDKCYVGSDDNVTVFADKGAITFFKESTTLFCDGTLEKKKIRHRYILPSLYCYSIEG